MKITKIEIRNFLGISSWKTDKLGKLNKITGGNGTGKSSVLKAIREAFKSSGVDPQLIKTGEKDSEIIVELDEKILIARKLKPSSNTVKVTEDDSTVNSPQKFLKSLIGELNFDPTEFFLAKPKQRRELLLSAIPFKLELDALIGLLNGNGENLPVDLSAFKQDCDSLHGLEALDSIQKHVYNTRHNVNLDVARIKKAIEDDKQRLPDHIDAEKFKDFDFNDKIQELHEAQDKITQHNNDESNLESLRNQAQEVLDEIEELEKKIRKAQQKLEGIEDQGKSLREKVDNFEKPDVESIKAEINEFHEFQKVQNKFKEIKDKQNELEGFHEAHQQLDRFYKSLTNEIPKKLLSEINMPIDGIEFKEEDILINGVAIDKLSTSEQIKLSIKIAKSLAGRLKVICVDRFESLDKKSRKLFETESVDDDFEYFMTVVTDGDLSLEADNPIKDPSHKNKEQPKPKGKEKVSKVGF